MTLFALMPVIEACRALYLNSLGILINCLLILAFGTIYYFVVINSKKHMELGITGFQIIFYFAAMITNYYGDTNHFSNSVDTFYFGYTCSVVEAAIKNRIPNFKHQVTFSLSCLLIREIFIPANDKSGIPVHLLMFAFTLYLDYDREKHDQALFGSYFYSKDQLTKFKDLVVNDIPDSIVILTQDITQCLFANSSFLSLADEDYNTNLNIFLNKFWIQEALGDSSLSSERSTNASSPRAKQTLLNFIQNHLRSQKTPNFPAHRTKKATCNVVYKRNRTMHAVTSLDQLEQAPEYSFEVRIMPLVWDEKPAIGVILHDITQQNTILRLKIAANLQKDRILATVSHELRTPLNSMLGMIEILLQQARENEMVHYLSICKNSGYLLLGLVNSILDLNLIRANKLKLYTEEVHLKGFLQDIFRLFEFQCKQKGIYLKLKVSSLVSRIITTDKNRLSQIMINLIGNALKFTKEGGITVSVEPYNKRKEYILLSVEDTGSGIKEEDKNKLFRMFGKLEHQDTVVNTQGVGLGLTISNNLAKLLCKGKDQGGIKVESQYNKGSKFSFLLPVHFIDARELNQDHHISCEFSSIDLDEGDVEENKPTSYQYKPSSPLKKPMLSLTTGKDLSPLVSPKSAQLGSRRPYVLIVDDNPLNITVAEYFVRSEQYEAKGALYGQTAIEILLNNNYELYPIKLVLMDLQMPIMDGYQTTKALRDLMESGKIPEIPIVASTANDSQNDKIACLKVGMKDHLSKPLQKSELRRVLKAYC